MGRAVRTTLLTIAVWLMTIVASSAQQVVDLSVTGPAGTAFQWVGPTAGARAGASMFRADMSGDTNRLDLIAGAPGSGPNGEGQVFISYMGPPHTGVVSLADADAIVTGQAAGDRFGAAVSAGMIVRAEVAPLPPRDLIVGAPFAFGGKGAVYLFEGPWVHADLRSASAAPFRVIGAPGDQLGSAVIATDLDGDGYRDIVMSAPGTGRIYVVFGGPSLAGTRDLSTQPADVTITLAAGTVTLAAADFNNDLFKDLAVGVPSAGGGAGAVFVVLGRARAAFPSTFALASASVQFTGIDAGDHAGATVQNADFDGDGVQDLVIGAPDGGGPGNARPGAGEVYVLWGSSHFGTSRSLAGADMTIFGAAAGIHLGTAMAHGQIRRDLSEDLVLLAPGASANGDIDIVYGSIGRSTSALDLAGGIDRVLHSDPAGAPLQSLVTMQVTGKADDVIAAAPDGTGNGNASAGVLYNVYSPALAVDPVTPSVTVAQGSTATVALSLANVGTLNVGWAARSNTSWLSLAPGTGTASAASPGHITLTIAPGNLPTGTYHGGLGYISLSRDVVWIDAVPVNLTVTPGSTSGGPPTNPFGVPDPPDEGSPNGVSTATGTNVQVLPIRDVLITFSNVTVAGLTKVEVVGNPHTTGNGIAWHPWLYRISTTATVSGPVSIGIAYDSTLAAPKGFIRIWDDAARVDTQRVDKIRNLVFGVAPGVPINVTVENDSHTDFSDDGHADLIWQNQVDGSLEAWFMQGPNRLAVGSLNPGVISDLSWKIVATADFDADGYPDLLWRNQNSGMLIVWFMRGTTLRGADFVSPNTVDPSWAVAAVADFNGDGYPDLLWRNQQTGLMVIWYMRVNTMAGAAFLNPSTVDPAWSIVGAADFNGDGHPDLVWQNRTSGQLSLWYMNGANLASATFLDPGSVSDLSWTISAVTDLDGDGHPDLVWRNQSSGQMCVWLMNGPNLRTFSWLSPITQDIAWKIVGAR